MNNHPHILLVSNKLLIQSVQILKSTTGDFGEHFFGQLIPIDLLKSDYLQKSLSWFHRRGLFMVAKIPYFLIREQMVPPLSATLNPNPSAKVVPFTHKHTFRHPHQYYFSEHKVIVGSTSLTSLSLSSKYYIPIFVHLSIITHLELGSHLRDHLLLTSPRDLIVRKVNKSMIFIVFWWSFLNKHSLEPNRTS